MASEATSCESTEGKPSAKALERVRNCADLRDRVTTEGPPSDFVVISVAGGAEVLVDSADADRVRCFRWHLDSRGRYARRSFRDGPTVHKVYLHHEIMGPGMVDHINGNGLDNRRCNLRHATAAENVRNSRVHTSSRCGLKGVGYDKRNTHRPWKASIFHGGRRLHLGYFPSAEEAALAYDAAAAKYFGEFAWLNFPGGAA